MASYCKEEEILSWFSSKAYSEAQHFSDREWFIALRYRRDFDEFDELLLKKSLLPEQRWKMFFADLPCSKADISALSSHFSQPSVAGFTEALEEVEATQVINTSLLYPTGEMRVLVINPNAPDKTLLTAFHQWLGSLRAEHQLPLKNRGRGKLKAHVSENMLGEWWQKHILECFDIDLWAKIHGRNPLPHDKLCKLLMGGQDKDWGRAARDKKKQVLGALMMLGLQG